MSIAEKNAWNLVNTVQVLPVIVVVIVMGWL